MAIEKKYLKYKQRDFSEPSLLPRLGETLLRTAFFFLSLFNFMLKKKIVRN